MLTSVNIPHEAAVRLLSLAEYEFIAKDYSVLPQIANNILTHTLGDPASYPSSSDGYNVIAEYDGTPLLSALAVLKGVRHQPKLQCLPKPVTPLSEPMVWR